MSLGFLKVLLATGCHYSKDKYALRNGVSTLPMRNFGMLLHPGMPVHQVASKCLWT